MLRGILVAVLIAALAGTPLLGNFGGDPRAVLRALLPSNRCDAGGWGVKALQPAGRNARNKRNTQGPMKTVFLVRHAESEENNKLGSLKQFFTGDLQWAKLKHGASLLGDDSVIDSQLSEKGVAQVALLTERLAKADFLSQNKVELVMHSPLVRARKTCEGVLASDASSLGKTLKEGVVVEEVIREKYISEWVPGLSSGLDERIKSFEEKIAALDQDIILVVGHSQFFKRMLGHAKKMKNCDVWKVDFAVDLANAECDEDGAPPLRWSNAERVLDVQQDGI